MKYSILLMCVLIYPLNACSQNWLWAKASASLGASPSEFFSGSEGWLVKTGPDQSVFIAGINYSKNICFGPYTFYDTITYQASLIGENPQIVLVKYDLSGNTLWAKASNSGSGFPTAIATDATGNLYLSGGFISDSIQFDSFYAINPEFNFGFPGDECNYFLIKVDPSGNIKWIRTGSLSFESVVYHISFQGGLTTDENNNVYIAGSFIDSFSQIGSTTLTNANPGTDDIFIAKYDAAGDPVWTKSFGGNIDDEVDGMVEKNGKIYITGNFNSPSLPIGTDTLHYIGPPIISGSTTENCYIAAMDTAGHDLWAISSPSIIYPTNIIIDQSNNIYFCGTVFYDTLIFDTDTIQIPASLSSGFFSSIDTNGHLHWIKVFRQISFGREPINNEVYGLTIDPCDNVWISAGIDTTGGMILNDTSLQWPAGSVDPMLIAEFNASGQLLSSYVLPTGGEDESGLAADSFGNIYLSADIFIKDPFVLGNDTMHIYNGGDENIFLAKFSPFKGGTIHSDSTICTGNSIWLQAPSGFSKYMWDNGINSSQVIVNDTGYYWVSCYSPPCVLSLTDSIHVQKTGLNSFVNDTIVCKEPGGQITLYLGLNKDATALWNTGDTSGILAVNVPGKYWADVSEGSCTSSDTFNISVQLCNCNITVPIAFTPNNDGKNDYFGVLYPAGCAFENFSLMIYNRWGNMVFKTDNYLSQWDGKFHGVQQDMGVYMYSIEYKTPDDVNVHRIKGDVTLVR